MSKKVQAMCYITITVVALSLVAVLYMLMPPCDNCGRKFCFGTCAILGDNISNDNPQTAHPQMPKNNQTATRLKETEMVDPAVYFQGVYLVGDSRTVGLRQHNPELPADRIFAKNSSNHEEAMYAKFVKISDQKIVSVPEAVRITAPKIIVVNFGINSAYMGTEKGIGGFMESYAAFVDELLKNSPNSIIVLEAVMPVSTYYEQSNPNISNENIDRINMSLLELARTEGFYYLATNEGMKNEYNALKDEYSDDGLHFSKAGYRYIFDYILTHAIIEK